MLWDLSDRLSHGLWMFSKRDSMAVMGCEVTPNPAQLPTSCSDLAGCLNSPCLCFLTCQLNIIILIVILESFSKHQMIQYV